MIATWPDTLPRPERDTWQKQAQDARRKRQAETGPPSYRRRFSSVPRMVTLSMLLDRDQRAIFDHFYSHVCADGSHLFRMPDPTTDGWLLLAADGDDLWAADGETLLLAGRWLCAWGDTTPTETIVGLEFRLSFSVVVIP